MEHFKHSAAKQKDQINQYLAKHGNRTGMAVVLDGAEAKTTKALINVGWDNRRIHVPNHSIDYNSLKHKLSGKCHIYPLPLLTFLRSLDQKKIGLLYMDYMCTLSGNNKVSPIEDLEQVFHNKLMMDGSMLAITLSLRSGLKNESGFINLPQKVSSIITSLAVENGYNCIVEPIGGIYKNGGPMWTGMFSLLGGRFV